MSEKLRVSFNSPQCGWMSLELRAGEQSIAGAVSDAPYDSMADLINALINILAGDAELTVRWAHNPDEMDFKFSARGDEARLEVDWYRNSLREGMTGERVFAFAGTRLDVCRPFRQALFDLQADIEVDEFARNWRREFPARELLRLAGEIEAAGQKESRGAEPSTP